VLPIASIFGGLQIPHSVGRALVCLRAVAGVALQPLGKSRESTVIRGTIPDSTNDSVSGSAVTIPLLVL